jgi:PAS domain S-box-containing protein
MIQDTAANLGTLLVIVGEKGPSESAFKLVQSSASADSKSSSLLTEGEFLSESGKPTAPSAKMFVIDETVAAKARVVRQLIKGRTQNVIPIFSSGVALPALAQELSRTVPGKQYRLINTDREDPLEAIAQLAAAQERRKRLRTTIEAINLQLSSKVPTPMQVRRLAVSERFHRSILATASDGIIALDPDERILWLNSAAGRMFSPENHEPTTLQALELGPEAHQTLCRLNNQVRQERVPVRTELRVTSLRGASKFVEISIAPVLDDAQALIGTSLIVRDVTERKKSEDALREAHAKLDQHATELEHKVAERTASLQEALQELEAFSYSVSHDLRSPLRAMQGYSHALIQDYGSHLPADAQEQLQRIARSSQRLDRLITDLLTYSKVSRANVRTETVALDRLMDDILQHYPNLQPPTVRVNVTSPLGGVLAHEPSLLQVVSNLLSNAVKFVASGKQPEVRVWSEERGQQLRLYIRDNGIGIKPRDQERIFKMFERVNPTRSYEGSGIGLAIVRKAMERMSGRVGVESDGQNGSTFWLELPRS